MLSLLEIADELVVYWHVQTALVLFPIQIEMSEWLQFSHGIR